MHCGCGDVRSDDPGEQYYCAWHKRIYQANEIFPVGGGLCMDDGLVPRILT